MEGSQVTLYTGYQQVVVKGAPGHGASYPLPQTSTPMRMGKKLGAEVDFGPSETGWWHVEDFVKTTAIQR